MSYRLTMTLIAAMIAATGLTASAFSLSQGATDQAIAFGWPAIAVALSILVLTPSRKKLQPRLEDGAKNGA